MNLITAVKQGDKQQLKLFYEKNRQPFLRFAAKYALPPDDLLDIYQDAIVAFIENIQKGKVDELRSSGETYLFAIGKMMVFQRIKKGSKTEFCDDFEQLGLEFEHYDESQNTETDARLRITLEKLGEQCKAILELFYYQEMKLEEIKTTLGYDSKDVVKSQKSRCLNQLKKLMK